MLYAFLLYLPTTIFGQMPIYVLAALYAIYRKRFFTMTPLLALIIVIVALSIFNFVFSINSINSEYSGSFLAMWPYAILMIPTYIIASTLQKKDLYFLIVFVLFEVGIGILEYIMGRTTFFHTGLGSGVLDVDSELLYNKRVLGISTNSSGFSSKILLALMCLCWLKDYFAKKWFIFSLVLLIIGLFITFNRTSILGACFFLMLYWIIQIPKRKRIFFLMFACLVILCTILYFRDVVFIQFFRSDTFDWTIVLAHRDVIFAKYLSFIKENLWWGNGSSKYWIPYLGAQAHAHNSFLMTLAANGVIISCFYFILLFVNRSIKIFPYIFTFIAISLTQYSIFWGISWNDIFLFYFLLNVGHNPFVCGKVK